MEFMSCRKRIVLRAATLEDEEKYGKCDSGRMRHRIYDTPDIVSWAAKYLLDRLYARPTRDEVIRERYARGERLSDLARAYGLSPARIHQIVHGTR